MRKGSRIVGRKIKHPVMQCKNGHPLIGDNLYTYKGHRYCTTCRYNRQTTWSHDHRRRECPRLYNLSVEQVEEKSRQQGHRCAICRKPCEVNTVLSVDHDKRCCPGNRSCGKCVRDLLCFRCNTVLGKVEEDRNLLLNFMEYIDKWNK